MTAGKGWIALALTTFATWRPARVLLGAYLFGGVTMLQFHLQGEGVDIASQLLTMLPYLATILVLVLISRNRGLDPRQHAGVARQAVSSRQLTTEIRYAARFVLGNSCAPLAGCRCAIVRLGCGCARRRRPRQPARRGACAGSGAAPRPRR